MLIEPTREQLVWIDGESVPWSRATMHLSDHHYGVGVFEGVRAYACGERVAVFRLAEHTARFLRSARLLDMTLRFDAAALEKAQLEVVRQNGLSDAYIRPFAFYVGAGGLAPRTRGLAIRVAVMALGWRQDEVAAQAEGRGLSLQTSSFTRHHANSLLSRAKANANYLNGIIAVQEAQRLGADDALLLDSQGYVTETSGANVFIVQGRSLLTPPLECVLEGITRDTVFELGAKLGLMVSERRLTRDDVYAADEVFITGTAAEIAPVVKLDGRVIGSGQRPVTEQLSALYRDVVHGRAPHRPEWLTWVR